MRIKEKMISISDFSKGKTSSIFDDVKKNNIEYVVLKNNQPTGVVVSFDWYTKMQNVFDNLKYALLHNRVGGVKIGSANGMFSYPEDFMKWDKEIEDLLLGE